MHLPEDFHKITRRRLYQSYQRYVSDYEQYLRMRGFGDHVHDRVFVNRAFIKCWTEPGFHNFWRAWNPGISYFGFRFYLLLGGKERRDLATISVFVLCGILHNLVALPFVRCWSLPLPFTFLSFGVLTILSQRLESIFRQERFPAIVNAAINIALVIASFEFGFRMNDALILR
jgi:hypothetical protein